MTEPTSTITTNCSNEVDEVVEYVHMVCPECEVLRARIAELEACYKLAIDQCVLATRREHELAEEILALYAAIMRVNVVYASADNEYALADVLRQVRQRLDTEEKR